MSTVTPGRALYESLHGSAVIAFKADISSFAAWGSLPEWQRDRLEAAAQAAIAAATTADMERLVNAPPDGPGFEVIRRAFREFLTSQGYDEREHFDQDEMELAFETGMLIQRAIAAAAPAQPVGDRQAAVSMAAGFAFGFAGDLAGLRAAAAAQPAPGVTVEALTAALAGRRILAVEDASYLRLDDGLWAVTPAHPDRLARDLLSALGAAVTVTTEGERL